MEERVRPVMEEYLELQHGASGNLASALAPRAACTQRRAHDALNVAGVNGADLATPTVTCRLDETSGNRMYNLTYRVKGTRAAGL